MKITYLHPNGLAEPVQFALVMSGEPWEDHKITPEHFEAIKADLPNNQVPVLEVDGKVLPQSGAQLRFVGKMAGLYPDDPLEAAFADAAIDTVADSRAQFDPYFHERHEARKVLIGQDIAENFLPRWLSNLERSVKTAGGKYVTGDKIALFFGKNYSVAAPCENTAHALSRSGLLMLYPQMAGSVRCSFTSLPAPLNQMSIGDIAVACRLEWIKKGHMEGVPTDMVDGYPLLSALFDRVYGEPRIVSYREGLLAAKA